MLTTRHFTRAASLVALVVGVASVPVHAQLPTDGFNPGANGQVGAMAVQADGKILVGGGFTGLGGGTGTTTRNYIGRLNQDGTVDATFNPGANSSVFAIAVQADGKIVVGGAFTGLGGGTGATTRNYIGRLNPDGTVDTTFNPDADNWVAAVALQPDGKILVGGYFTQLGGVTATATRNRIARLHADGSLDTTFNPGANNAVRGFGLEPDGQIVVFGDFTMLAGGGTGTTTRNRIGRLHANGSLDSSFNPGANGTAYALTVQPDGKILVGGSFTTLGGGGTGTTPRNRLGRLNPNGSLDTTFDPGSNGLVYDLSVQSDGKIVVGGDFTMLGGSGTGATARNRIGRLNPDGTIDTTFNPGASGRVFAVAVQSDGKILVGGIFAGLGGGTGTTVRDNLGRLHADGSIDVDLNPGANNTVYAIAVQPDGKILVGGNFTTLGGGGTGTTTRNHIGRLNQNGTVDTTFNPGANSIVYALAVQPDGKILVGGFFTGLGGGTGTTVRNRIGRLNPDGTVDTTFNPGANDFVYVLAVQSDGRIIVGGGFTGLGGGTGTTVRNRIGQLNPDGTLDTTFNPGANLDVYSLAVQSDGKIVVGGGFTGLGGGTGTSVRNYVGRLNPDGTLDTTFNPGANGGGYAIAVQPDGKIVVGGGFTGLGGGTGTTTRNRIGRINPDGTLDTTFNPGANGVVRAVAIQPDGQILVGGSFTLLGGGGTGTTTRYGIGRINQNGTVDMTFNPGANDDVFAMAEQSDGKILVGGTFTGLGGGTGTTVRNRIGRLPNTAAAFQRLNVACPGCVKGSSPSLDAAVTWTRSGAGPEVMRVTFELSGDGVSYVSAGAGTRVGNEWQVSHATGGLGQHFYVRARGYYNTGFFNGSGSIVESIRKVTIACPTLPPTPLPAGTINVAYNTTLTAADALGLVSFSTTSTLPTGVTLSSAGVLSGTPLQAGPFTLTVLATDTSSGCAASRAYTLTINPPPTMTLDRTALRFAAVMNGPAFVAQTAAQPVRLTQTGTGSVTWTATSNQPWLQVSPTAGSGSATLSVSVSAVGVLPVGSTVVGAITVTVTGASTTPAPVTVALQLIQNGTSTNPFGFIDTPLDHTTGVTGAIPFTGWALDDVEVTRVTVCRAAFGAEVAPIDPNCGGAAQIFVGTAVFIDGARPDVAAAYPTLPLNTRAGWGFMVLTNMLPNQGNGSYVFAMHAEDREGRTTLLGTRTITCANASATKPFGAIDTPTQGGTASGSSFVNFGWALTPLPKTIPTDGSTITVQVDGVTLGTATYNNFRSDIASLFPGLNNTDGAVGFRILDTTTLSDGLHTIQWVVSDSHGAVEGIGSRFFTVANGAGGSVTAAGTMTAARPAADAATVSAVALDGTAGTAGTGLVGRRGWDDSAPLRAFPTDAAGRTLVRSEEVNRIELQLGPGWDAGYLRTGEGLARLPIGSHLDPTTGVFTWAPGVGFVGAYDLVFIRHEDAQARARREVRVLLAPKGSGRVGPQVVIDTPTSQQDVGQPFVLAGWAADLAAAARTGIATLHAWAYPLAGGPPVFLGTTAYGGARPDVAAVHGDQFTASGFGLRVQGLAHGHYDLAVFAWSTEAADFVPASVVRITVR